MTKDTNTQIKTVVSINDVKKGMRVRLENGWEAEMMDSKRTSIRLARVFGDFEEVGSIYAHDIWEVLQDGEWLPVLLTPSLKKQAEDIKRQQYEWNNWL